MVQHIYFVRHGDTQMNDQHLIRGWLDVPLSAKGIKASKAVAKRLSPKHVQGIVTTDLSRGVDTAEFIRDATGAPILATTKKLRTWDLGIYTGTPSDTADKEIKQLISKSPDKTIPEGESFNAYRDRFLDTVLSLLTKYKDLNIVIVNHHSGAAVMQTWIDSGAPEDYKMDPTKMASAMTRDVVKPGDYLEYNGIWSRSQQKMV